MADQLSHSVFQLASKADHALNTPSICLLEESDNENLTISYLNYGSNKNAKTFAGGERGAKILLLAYPR